MFHETGYTIVHKVSWGVSDKASIYSTDFSSIVFIVTGIPYCCSEFLNCKAQKFDVGFLGG